MIAVAGPVGDGPPCSRSCYDRDRAPRPTVPPDRYVRHTRRPHPRRCGTDRRRAGDGRPPAGPASGRSPVAAGCAQGHRLRLLHRHLAARRHATPPCTRGRRGCSSPRTTCSGTSSSRSPTPTLNFGPGDQIVGFAEANQQLVIGAHLAWDEGFGEGWTDDDLWGISRKKAQKLLYGVIRARGGALQGPRRRLDRRKRGDRPLRGRQARVPHQRAVVPARSVRSTSAESFHIAEEEDPDALRIINEFGFETVNEFGDGRSLVAAPTSRRSTGCSTAACRSRRSASKGHLLADEFAARFDEKGYRAFLARGRRPGPADPHHRDGRARRRACRSAPRSATGWSPTSTAATST